jgi:formylglycine-generating enzyme required for sulfatase activity
MTNLVRVFVSHHHSPEEDAFTARLVADLEAAGADVWVDDARITADDFIKKINEGLTGRQWLVLVMTTDSLRSPWVQAEVNAALLQVRQGRMLGVIPLVAQPCNDADIPPLWAPLHRYDATKGYDTAREGLFGALSLIPGRTAPPVQPTPPPHTTPPDRFPLRLARMGYRVAFQNGVETILPPMCEVPAGYFFMGSDLRKDKGAFQDEEPQSRVTLGAFAIAEHPVTVSEYACFMRATNHSEPSNKYNQLTWRQQLANRLDNPVVNVSWQDAMDYAQWLTTHTGQLWRLPNEAEWEKTARGTDGRIYPWGNSFDAKRCNTREGKKGDIAPVGTYSAGISPYGALDMSGNIWEWTSTIFQAYPWTARDGREYVGSPEKRVLRGGSWDNYARAARVACRVPRVPDYTKYNYGFRLARSVPNS